jgi:hypothetical protein
MHLANNKQIKVFIHLFRIATRNFCLLSPATEREKKAAGKKSNSSWSKIGVIDQQVLPWCRAAAWG